jgi:hypothetical protein
MNPLYGPAVSLATIGTIFVAIYDHGKTRTPPAGPVGSLLSVSATSSVTPTSFIVSNTMGIRAEYDVRTGKRPVNDIE